MTTFADLDLIQPLQRAVQSQGYERPTPIQAESIPPLLDGRDVLGCAQTGSGKTAAFTLPVLQHLADAPQGRRRLRALVLTPTRELAAQIGESFRTYGQFLNLRHTVIFGGVNQKPQVRALERGLDAVVATPGRLLDLMGQGHIDLRDVDFFVLDEADRMLDMGFIHDIRKVLKVLPSDRQNLLFSATMPPSIVGLAGGFLDDPVHIEVDPESSTVERIHQQVMFVERANKRALLSDLVHELNIDRALVFTRTKHGANRLVKQLDRDGIESAAIHGNKSQNARNRALDGFRKGTIRLLVATDLAARGIDVEGISHVFNYELPNISETYVHRIGRTARAGRDGIAISFCDDTEGGYLRDIEKLIDQDIEVVEDHPYHDPSLVPPPRRRGGRRREQPARKPRNPRNQRSQRSEPKADSGPERAEVPRRRRRRRRKPAGEGQAQPAEARPAQPKPRSEGGDEPRRPRRRRRRRRGPRPGGNTDS